MVRHCTALAAAVPTKATSQNSAHIRTHNNRLRNRGLISGSVRWYTVQKIYEVHHFSRHSVYKLATKAREFFAEIILTLIRHICDTTAIVASRSTCLTASRPHIVRLFTQAQDVMLPFKLCEEYVLFTDY